MVSVTEVAATKHGQRFNSMQQRTTQLVLPELGGSVKLSVLQALKSQQHSNAIAAAAQGGSSEQQSGNGSGGTLATSAEQAGGGGESLPDSGG